MNERVRAGHGVVLLYFTSAFRLVFLSSMGLAGDALVDWRGEAIC